MITGLSIHYLHYCERKLWLYSHGIKMENTSEIVSDGRIIHNITYTRRSEKFKNIDVGYGIVDYIDIKNKIVYETKRSSSNLDSSIIQLKLYLYSLNDNEYIGIIEIPKERKKVNVSLTLDDITNIENDILNINYIISSKIPKKLNDIKCKLCSYYIYCYS